jgi:hypothetical protein
METNERTSHTRVLTALYEVRLQRKLLITRPLKAAILNPAFQLTFGGMDVTLSLILDEIPRQESPKRGIAICQASKVEIRVRRTEPATLPNIIPIPQGQGPEAQAWHEAQSKRSDECTIAAVTVLNRLLAFFKYGLRNPLLEPFEAIDLYDHKWLNEEGSEIPTGLMSFNATWTFRPVEQTLTPDMDVHLQYRLENEATPTLVEEILLDAMGALENDNLRQAIIEAAVCAEVATRESFSFEYLDEREHPVTVPVLLSRIAHAVSGFSFDVYNRAAFADINILFRARNKGAHEGRPYYIDEEGGSQALTKSKARELIRSVEILLFWLSLRG